MYLTFSQVIDQLFARDTNNIDWEFIHGLFANAIYGGRVDDVHDIRILTSYLKDMFNPEVISTGKRPLGPVSLPGSTAGMARVDLKQPSFLNLNKKRRDTI